MKIKEFFDIKMCKRVYKSQRGENLPIPFYTIKTLGGVAEDFISQELFDKLKNKYDYPIYGNVLISCSGTIGKIVKYNGEDSYFQDSNIMWLSPKKDNIDQDYIYYFLSNLSWNNLSSSTLKRLYKVDLLNLEFKYLPLHVQEKIGSFFKELDELIDLTKESIHYYETVRKGIRQKIFAGEKIQINKLVSIRKGKQLNKDDFDNNGPYPVYNGAKKEIGYHSQYNEEGPKIIINEGGSSGTVSKIKTNFWASGHSYVLDIMEDIDINLLYEALKKEEPKLKSMAYGAGIPSVKAIDILNHYINLPIIPYNKVLDIFENINYIIDELQCKVILLEQTKKYYLNKIFN